jgi:hypothetical protein
MKYLVFCLTFLFSVSLLADTGQVRVFRVRKYRDRFMLFRYTRNQLPFPVPTENVPPLIPAENVPPLIPAENVPPLLTFNYSGAGTATVTENIKPFEEDLLNFSDEGRGAGFFQEGIQQAAVAWNGKEEIIILTTKQLYPDGNGGAVVSFFPLNGKPKDIYEGEPKVFGKVLEKIEEIADAKIPNWRKEYRDEQNGRLDGGDFKVLIQKDIGSHHIAAIEVLDKDIDSFYTKLQEYIVKNFGDDAAAYIDEDAKKVFEHYIKDLNFKYFAIDIQEINQDKDKKQKEKEAIAYHFESKQLYFPLYISKLGGTGKTQVQLAVITPDKKLTLTGHNTLGFYTPSVKMSEDDIKGIDENFFKLMSDADTSLFLGRVWTIDGQLDKFEKDFIAE